MIFEQFYLGCLAHASYLIGSDGVAAVVDPQRDVRIYLDAAREPGCASLISSRRTCTRISSPGTRSWRR